MITFLWFKVSNKAAFSCLSSLVLVFPIIKFTGLLYSGLLVSSHAYSPVLLPPGAFSSSNTTIPLAARAFTSTYNPVLLPPGASISA